VGHWKTIDVFGCNLCLVLAFADSVSAQSLQLPGDQLPHKIEDSIVQTSGYWRSLYFYIWSYATATINWTTEIGAQGIAVLAVCSGTLVFIAVQVVIIE